MFHLSIGRLRQNFMSSLALDEVLASKIRMWFKIFYKSGKNLNIKCVYNIFFPKPCGWTRDDTQHEKSRTLIRKEFLNLSTKYF